MKYNKVKSGFIILLLTFITFLPALKVQAQETPDTDKRLVESVTVTNIQVPVRVLHNGKPVTGLTINDFVVLEDKKQVKLNGFFVKNKKIRLDRRDTTTTITAEAPVTGISRTFVLVFNITDYNDSFKEAIEYLFTNLLRKNDQVLIFANNKTLHYKKIENLELTRSLLETALKEESGKARRRLQDYIYRVENNLRVNDFRQQLNRGDDDAYKLLEFLKRYLLIWNEYKKNYLTPRVNRFYYFSRFLENIRGEKWVLNFYQFELFPRIRMGSSTMLKLREITSRLTNTDNANRLAMGRIMEKILGQLSMDLNVNNSFPTEEVTKLFYKVDATFHSFFIKATSRVQNDFEYQTLSSDIEKILKGITDATGGRNLTSNKVAESLGKVREVEDVYYVLVYVPKNPHKKGKLKVKVANKEYEVLYDDNFRADYISDYFNKLEKKITTPDIKIEDFSFNRKVLAFTIRDYWMRPAGKNGKKSENRGQIKIRIKVLYKNGEILFNQEKLFTAVKKETKISLNRFKRIESGEYDFLIDAVDLFTNKQVNLHKNIIVKR